MGLIDLKSRLHDVPGVEGLTMQVIAGRPTFGINGKVVSVSKDADEDDAANAIRAAMGSPAIVQIPAGVPLRPSADKIPPVAFPAKPKATAMTNPAAGFAASIKAMLDDARAGIAKAQADGLAKVKDAVTKLDEAKTATANVATTMAATIESEASSVLAELGQISNFPPSGEK